AVSLCRPPPGQGVSADDRAVRGRKRDVRPTGATDAPSPRFPAPTMPYLCTDALGRRADRLILLRQECPRRAFGDLAEVNDRPLADGPSWRHAARVADSRRDSDRARC